MRIAWQQIFPVPCPERSRGGSPSGEGPPEWRLQGNKMGATGVVMPIAPWFLRNDVVGRAGLEPATR